MRIVSEDTKALVRKAILRHGSISRLRRASVQDTDGIWKEVFDDDPQPTKESLRLLDIDIEE